MTMLRCYHTARDKTGVCRSCGHDRRAPAPTHDQLAIRALIRGDEPALAELRRQVDAELRPRCPECGGDHVEDNCRPSTDWDFTRLCVECGAQWSPNC